MEMKVYDGETELHEAKYNICDRKRQPDMVRLRMSEWAIPDHCPITGRSTFCYNPEVKQKLSSVSRKMLGFFLKTPTVTIKINIKHDTGDSCFEALSTVIKSE